jgi:hypothetical protein
MIRGLLWLPLLIVFIGLAWAGWNEYQKIETYRVWAEQFDRAKYDIYAVLGQKGNDLTWGKATRQGVIEVQTFSLEQVKQIELRVNGQAVETDRPPNKAKFITLNFQLQDASQVIEVPFTDLTLAIQWEKFLQQAWQALQSG